MAITSSASSWRSSKTLLIFTATLGLFTENFLFGFIVPLLPYMIEIRLGLPASYTQRTTTELLSALGLISIISAPIIAHLADLTSSKKLPLLLSLLGCVAGTLLVATTISLPAVYAGRVLQGISGTGAWIVGFAMLTDSAEGKGLGKTLGFAGSFITAGIVLGPAAGGILLELVGYWWAWSVPLALLGICLVARLAMIEEPKSTRDDEDSSASPQEEGENVETTPLLPETTTEEEDTKVPTGTAEKSSFYKVILKDPVAWAAMFNVVAFSTILSGFDATLPLHLRDTFGWGPAPIGSIFLGIQVPGMILGPLIGWLRDRIGLRWPTTVGWLLLAPLLWFAGVPGKWEGVGDRAFVGCIVSIGIITTLFRGAGTFQLTTTLHELRAKNPDVFGPGGGSSKMFSLTEISFNVGLMLGPLLCGSLSDAYGFEYSAWTLAGISLAVACSSCIFFTHKSAVRREENTEEGAA